jgi:hypothetical protein
MCAGDGSETRICPYVTLTSERLEPCGYGGGTDTKCKVMVPAGFILAVV